MDPEILASYLPITLVTRALAEPSGLQTEGVVVFIDISGFTRITNECIRQNPARGVEVISRRLNVEFGTWIDLITNYGGEVIKFAGDALLALWRSDSEELGELVRWASACARELQDRRHGMPATGLQIRIGLEAGEVRVDLVELGPGRRDVLISGPTLERTLGAQAVARPGELVCGRTAVGLLGAQAVGMSLPGGALRLDRLRDPVIAVGPLGREPLPPTAALEAFVPPVVHSTRGDIGEIRPVLVMFVGLPAATVDERRSLLAEHVAVVAALHGGVINKLNIDDKGPSALIAFGLPGSIYFDTAARNLFTALLLRTRCGPGALHLGIATGTALCGIVGNASRREYTLIGSSVNRAARLMQACARGGPFALCDQATVDAARAWIECRSRDFQDLPGHDAPVAVFEPDAARTHGSRAAKPHRSEFVGYAAELKILNAHTERLGSETALPAVALIEGEPGAGKSRLADEAAEHAARQLGEHAPAIHYVTSEAQHKGIPYHAWSAVFHEISARGLAAIRERLDPSPELLPHLCLLNPLLGLELPESDATRRLEPRVRADYTVAMLVALLPLCLHGARGLFIVEDVHLSDSASWALCVALTRSTLPILLILTFELWPHPPVELRELQALAGPANLRLRPLASDDIRRIVCVRLGVDELPPPLFEFIRERAQGNPSRAKQTVHELIEREVIGVRERQVHVDAVKLDELRQRAWGGDDLVISRVDRLTPEQKAVVFTASCIGAAFRFDLLLAVATMPEVQLLHVIDSLVALRMFSADRQAAWRGYRFTYPRTRGTLEAQLLSDQYRSLHRKIAVWYEAAGARAKRWNAGVLAHHWRLAGDVGNAIACLEIAGQFALDGYHCREAIESFRVALELADGEPTVSAQERVRWYARSGDACLKLGEHESARTNYTAALKLLGLEAKDDRMGHARSLLGHVAVQLWRRIRRSPAVLPAAAVDESTVSAAQIYQGLAEVAYFNQERLRLLQATFAGLNHAEDEGDPSMLAWAYATVAITMGLFSLHTAAKAYSGWSIAVARASSQPSTEAYALLLQGVYHSTVPNREAVGYAAAAEMFTGLGDRSRAATAELAEAFYCLALGDLERAGSLCQAHLERRDLAPQLRVWTLCGHLLVAMTRGVPDPRSVVELEQVLGSKLQHADHILGTGVVALAHLRRNDLERARMFARSFTDLMANKPSAIVYTAFGLHAAIEVFTALAAHDRGPRGWLRDARRAGRLLSILAWQNPIVAPRALIARGQVAFARGERRRALELWDRALHHAKRLTLPYAEALAELAIGRHLPRHDAEYAEHLSRAETALQRLGVRPENTGIPG